MDKKSAYSVFAIKVWIVFWRIESLYLWLFVGWNLIWLKLSIAGGNASKGVDDGINMVYISIIGLEAKCGACKWCEGIFARY